MHNIDTYVIDEIVADLGYYSPVELLLRTGRLRYPDYEGWRYGRHEFICELLMGSPKRIINQLAMARDHLLAQNFMAEPLQFHGWQGEKTNQLLAFCPSSSEFESVLLSTQYRRKQSVPQLDLFFDNQAVQLANELIQALAGRNVELAENKLSQLEQADPNHALCGQGAKLLTALHKLKQNSILESPALQLDEIRNNLMPLANEALKGRTRDFLAPFWRQLAGNLAGKTYTEDHPDLHPAFCYSQILLWPDVISSVINTTEWRQYPRLYRLLIHAYNQNDQRTESIQLVCDFCWRFAGEELPAIPDAHTSQLWNHFIDRELDDKWGQQHFPAWLLLHEEGLVGHLKADHLCGNEAFSVLQKLLQSGNNQDIDLRQRLKAENADIFEYFLRKFSQL